MVPAYTSPGSRSRGMAVLGSPYQRTSGTDMATHEQPAHALRRIEDLTLTERRAIFGTIALVATDVDGTLTSRGEILAPVLAALADLAAAGIEVVPVSGRPAGEVLGLVRYLP